MSDDDTSRLDLEFTGIYLHSDALATLTAETAELSEKNIDHALLYFYMSGKWYGLKKPDAIVSACALQLNPPQLYFLSPNGRVYKRIQGQDSVEVIDKNDDGPSDLLQMKAMRLIGGELYVVGMARRAYKRGPDGVWQAIDGSCFVPRGERKESLGFNAVAGQGPTNIYAVGYKGEIWHFDSRVWHQELSPTNLTLTCIVCESNGSVFAAGLSGILLVKQGQKWEVLPQTKTKDNFWGMVAFRGAIYVSTQSGIFKVVGQDLEPVALTSMPAPSSGLLGSTTSTMWSVGNKDIFSTSDGLSWVRINNP